MPEFDNASYVAITNLIRAHHVWLILNADDVVPRPNATNEYDNDDFQRRVSVRSGRNCSGIYHKQKARHLRRIYSARALAAVREMFHAHHRQFCGGQRAGDI